MSNAPSTPPEHPLIGKTISNVRPMTREELDREGWDGLSQGFEVALEFDDGGNVYALKDPEGNGPGVMIHNDTDGKSYYLHAGEVE